MRKSDFFGDFQNLAIPSLTLWPCYCMPVLELNTFFLGQDIITQNFSSHGCPYKSYESPPTIMAIST